MLTSSPFYFSSIRNLVIGFGSLFDNIKIQRFDDTGAVTKTLLVPLAFMGGDKTIIMNQTQGVTRAESQIEVKTSLPRLSFSIDSVVYDAARKKQVTLKNKFNSTTLNSKKVQFDAVPYNIGFSLNAYVKYADDGFQIMEQILPYFVPMHTITLKDCIVADIDLPRDVSITLTSVQPDDQYESIAEEDRILTWNYTFTANTWIYPPIFDAKIIKRVTTNFYDFNTEQRLSSTMIEVNPFDANEDDPHTLEVTKT